MGSNGKSKEKRQVGAERRLLYFTGAERWRCRGEGARADSILSSRGAGDPTGHGGPLLDERDGHGNVVGLYRAYLRLEL